MMAGVHPGADSLVVRRISNHALSVLQNVIPGKIAAGDTLDIILVSHSNYMKTNLACGRSEGRKPLNMEPWLETYNMAADGSSPLVSKSSNCKVLDKDLLSLPPKPICSATVARCKEGFKRTEDFFSKRKGCFGNPVCPK